MNRLITLSLLALMFMVTLQACGSNDQSETEVAREIPVVEVVEASVSERAMTVTFSGTLEPLRQTNVGANTPGRIERIFVEEGDRVTIGDPLVQMEDNQLRQARIQFETAKREYERLVPLHAEGAVTRQQLDLAQTEMENAEITLNVLVENTTLRSGLNGIVTEKWFEENELYSAAPTESGAPGIVQVMQINPLRLIINVNETRLSNLDVGQTVRLTSDALPGREFQSQVSRIFPTVDSATRTVRVEVIVENNDSVLRPGMFVRATLQTAEYEELFIPREALMRGTSEGSQDIVYTINENNQAVRQIVQVGMFLDELVSIERGIESGDRVVVKGKLRLEDGMEVRAELYQP
ncbi:MAG TPA: efflux RND transporter periplasmic adaptor subunit [Balneolaceae bacterium]|nr:efflux RND transporter periplasmic adaptor subunit [Balneolaceae bacterium]